MNLFECKAEFKASDKPNFVEGYASTFNGVDLGGDMILPGAFAKTIKERVPAGRVKFLADHDWWSINSVLGTVREASEDDHGLYFKAEISEAPSAQDALVKMREGHVDRLSIGYDAIQVIYPDDAERMQTGIDRKLVEVKLREISAITFPMNEDTEITGVKSVLQHEILPLLPSGAIISEIKALPFKEARKAYILSGDKPDDCALQVGVKSGDTLYADPVLIRAAAAKIMEIRTHERGVALIKSYLTKYYEKMGETLPWGGNRSLIELLKSKTAEPEKPLTAQGVSDDALRQLKFMERNLEAQLKLAGVVI